MFGRRSVDENGGQNAVRELAVGGHDVAHVLPSASLVRDHQARPGGTADDDDTRTLAHLTFTPRSSSALQAHTKASAILEGQCKERGGGGDTHISSTLTHVTS